MARTPRPVPVKLAILVNQIREVAVGAEGEAPAKLAEQVARVPPTLRPPVLAAREAMAAKLPVQMERTDKSRQGKEVSKARAVAEAGAPLTGTLGLLCQPRR